MTNNKIKYWVTELSDHAQDLLIKHCTQQLAAMGYCRYEINRYVEDLADMRLGNLNDLVSNDMLEMYSSM